MCASKEKLQPQSLPLMRDAKTYNTAHPDFKIWMSNCFPGKIYSHSRLEEVLLGFPDNIRPASLSRLASRTTLKYPILGSLYCLDRLFSRPGGKSDNPLFRKITSLSRLGAVAPASFTDEFAAAWREINDTPLSKEIFERRAWMENWLNDLNDRKPGTYFPGWINFDDAIFLYWMVRLLKPRTLVQTGVCNGVSSAFITLALLKNGGEGKLYAIDYPYIYDPDDPAFNQEAVYGVIIPEGKTSGWMVPEELADRFEVIEGMAEEKLPALLERLGKIDFFYHDSDHSYDHMMFEMTLAEKHLNENGVIACDDVSWNRATWDFARINSRPAYNYNGSIGVVFF